MPTRSPRGGRQDAAAPALGGGLLTGADAGTLSAMADATEERTEQHELPEPDAAKEWLQAMLLIRRFEERAGEMYAKAKVGGFLHLAIGEEATIVGAVRAMRDEDYLISTYRSHGHALARGT